MPEINGYPLVNVTANSNVIGFDDNEGVLTTVRYRGSSIVKSLSGTTSPVGAVEGLSGTTYWQIAAGSPPIRNLWLKTSDTGTDGWELIFGAL